MPSTYTRTETLDTALDRIERQIEDLKRRLDRLTPWTTTTIFPTPAPEPKPEPEPPCPIDQVEGWAVYQHPALGTIAVGPTTHGLHRQIHHPDGITFKCVCCQAENGVLHPWPEPPQYQPGDPVDVKPYGAGWVHSNRTYIGVAPTGEVLTRDQGWDGAYTASWKHGIAYEARETYRHRFEPAE